MTVGSKVDNCVSQHPVERVISSADGFVGGHLLAWLYAVLQRVQEPLPNVGVQIRSEKELAQLPTLPNVDKFVPIITQGVN